MSISSSPVAGTGDTFRPLRILLADDEPMIVALLRRLLERRGHTVRAASSAGEALSLLERHRFDAALVDARMPGDGLTVVAQLREDRSFDGIIVLMTGALATDPDVQAGPGVVRLQKPFNHRELFPLLEGGAKH